MNYRLFACLLVIAGPCLAAPPEPQDKYLARCALTPQIKPVDRYIGQSAIVPSNKLALPAGKAVYANGELVYLSGRVLDENCVPVSDAIVEIWQTDPSGTYVKSMRSDRMNADPHFTGSGRAVTDNLGRYNFVTLYPGAYSKRAPHIHFHVTHPNFKTFDTEMFFAGDALNDSDAKLRRIKPEWLDRLEAKTWARDANQRQEGVAARWDITLAGKNKFRKF